MDNKQILYVDFNDTAPKRRVIAWLGGENAHVLVAPGDVVQLRDDDGFACEGVVERAGRSKVLVAPAWATWRNPNPLRLRNKPDTLQGALMTSLWSVIGTSPETNTESMDLKILARK